MRFIVTALFGPPFVVAIVAGLIHGNPLAWGMAVGYAVPMVAAWLMWAVPDKPKQPTRDLRLSSEAPTMIASEARKVRGIQ